MTTAIATAIILFSILIFPVSGALHKLKHWAYTVSFGLLLVFSLVPFLFSFGLFSHSTAVFYSFAILILNILVGATLYQNRSLFIDRQGLGR